MSYAVSLETPEANPHEKTSVSFASGKTQSNWLHSIPKRASNGVRAPAIQGRINITFRKNMTAAGTENYYRYNVGSGPVWKWDEKKKEMKLHEASASGNWQG